MSKIIFFSSDLSILFIYDYDGHKERKYNNGDSKLVEKRI